MTNIEWEDTYKDYYDRKSVRIQTLLARVIGNIFAVAANEKPEEFGEFEFIGVEVAGWEKDELSTNLAINMYGSFTYVKKIDLLEIDLSTLGSELDFSCSLDNIQVACDYPFVVASLVVRLVDA